LACDFNLHRHNRRPHNCFHHPSLLPHAVMEKDPDPGPPVQISKGSVFQ
jgi:hypothetical protein